MKNIIPIAILLIIMLYSSISIKGTLNDTYRSYYQYQSPLLRHSHQNDYPTQYWPISPSTLGL